MAWLENYYNNYRKGYSAWRIRVWSSPDENGKRKKITAKRFRIPIQRPCIDKFRLTDNLVCYLFSPITVDDLENPSFFTQITLNDNPEAIEKENRPDDMKMIWLSDYPGKQLEQFFDSDEEEPKGHSFICGGNE